MSPHGHPKGPRCGKLAAAVREAGIGAQAPLPVHTHPFARTTRSGMGAT